MAPRDLAAGLSCRYTRRVAHDNTVRLGPRWVQLPRRRSHASRRVELRECLDGRLLVFADGARLATQPAPPAPPACISQDTVGAGWPLTRPRTRLDSRPKPAHLSGEPPS